MKLEYVVTNLSKYETIKEILKEEFDISNRLLVKLKNSKQIYLNNLPVSVNHKVEIGDKILVDLDFNEECENIIPTKIDLDILYEDDSLLIVNKPPYMPIHPSMDHYGDSLSNGIKYYFNSINLKRKIRPVNRLDKNTSGIVIFAKNEYVQECLIKQMKNNEFCKKYLAVIDGILDDEYLVIDAPITRKENSIIERCVSEYGDNAITELKPLKAFTNYSLVECVLKTGRTHQIRVHMNHIGHSIIGDDLYGKKSNLINRQALHAYYIRFIHPVNKKIIEIEAKIPKDIESLI